MAETALPPHAKGDDMPPAPIGQSVARVDGVAKVTGRARYAIDCTMPDMLSGVVVRATRGHARITAIDVDEALATNGCVAVITGDDVRKQLYPRFGHIIPDHPILAMDKVRYYGEPVALVLGETLLDATDAAAKVEVSYDDLPVATDVGDALADGAEPLHTETYDRGGSALAVGFEDASSGNVAHATELTWGDVDTAMTQATHIVESKTYYPMLYAFAMEPYNAIAHFDSDGLEIIATAQHPFMVQRDVARVFDMPLSRVRVTSPFVGGGYGSKSYTKIEPLAAVGAFFARRPVKVAFDVEESILTTRADAAHVHVRTGFDADGKILARDFDVVLDTGAYADNSPLVLDKAVNRCFGPYQIPNLRVRGRAVYTNTSPASSYRGFGAFQGNLAGETNIDRAAEELGIDPVELRRRNLIDKGVEFMPGRRPIDGEMVADLAILAEHVGVLEGTRGTASADGLLHGAGIGLAASDAGAMPTSTAQVRIASDGSALVLTGSSEMGQGSRTVLSQIAAAELRLPLTRVRIHQSDTVTTPFERTTGASRTTTLVGLSVQRACHDAVTQFRAIAAEIYDAEADNIEVADGGVILPDGTEVGYGELVDAWFGSGGGEVTGFGVVRRTGELAQLPPFWELGLVGVSVSIDPETGAIDVDKLVTVADIGLAINPAGIEGQDLGAATQGLGGALFEELHYDGAQLANGNLVEYRVPRLTDRPSVFDSVIVERRDGVGPYGAKGVGEGALNPIGSAVASAVARATGVWPDRLPLTPERVWRLVNGLGRRDSERAPLHARTNE